MALIEIERNDTIACKDGRAYRALSIYKSGNNLLKVEAIDDKENSPMRRTIYPQDIVRVIKRPLPPPPPLPAKEEVYVAQTVTVTEPVPAPEKRSPGRPRKAE